METGHKTVVTGFGIVSSIGTGVMEFEEALRAGKSGISFLKERPEVSDMIRIGAEISNFNFKSQIENMTCDLNLIQKAENCAQRAPFGIQTAVVSSLEAWSMASLERFPVAPERIGLIIAGNNLTNNYQFSQYPKFNKMPEYLSPRYALHFLDTDHVGTLSEIFSIQGEGFTVGSASASGNAAIIKAHQLLKLGILDVCLVVGAMSDLSPLDIQGFYNLGSMGGKKFIDNPEKACRPFDKDHEGFIYGQGCGVLILESGQSSKNRGARVYAEIAGGAQFLDGNRLSNPDVNGEVRVMQKVLEEADVKPEEVDYINTHGTSSKLGDETEIKAIREVFKNNVKNVWINSTKGLTGHCLYSASIIETIATVIQMNDNFVHSCANLDDPIDNECCFVGKEAQKAEINTALKNAFAFGGINTSILIKKGDI